MSYYVRNCVRVITGAILPLLISCSEISPVLVSGSSYFSFIDYFINPVSESVIAVENSTSTTPLAADAEPIVHHASTSLTPGQIRSGLTATDTKLEIFSTSYCDYFAESLASKIDTSYLQDARYNADDVTNAPFLAEKAYLELMKNYCYTSQLFLNDDKPAQQEDHATFGAIRWYRNTNANLGGSRNFDYLISQAEKENKTHILTTFREIEPIAQEKLYGQLQLTQTDTDDIREFNLIRYFVDNRTKTAAIPDTLRQEGYAMSTSVSNHEQVHHIATYYLDYQQNSAQPTENKLVIHYNSAVVYQGKGSKIVTAEYCEYPDGAIQYDCADASSDKKASIRTPVYFNTSGNRIDASSDIAASIDTITNTTLLNALQGRFAASQHIPAPIELRKDLDLDARFDTSSDNAYLNF